MGKVLRLILVATALPTSNNGTRKDVRPVPPGGKNLGKSNLTLAPARMYSGSGASPARRINMRWQLAGDWPVGPAVIPAGTIISAGEAPNYQAIPLAELPNTNPLRC